MSVSTIVRHLFVHLDVVRQHALQKCVRTPIPALTDTPPKMQNKPAFLSRARVHAAAIVILSLKSHLAPIEIP